MTQLELEIHDLANHEQSELEVYRRRILHLENEITLLKQQIAEENELKYDAYKKIAELTSRSVF